MGSGNENNNSNNSNESSNNNKNNNSGNNNGNDNGCNSSKNNKDNEGNDNNNSENNSKLTPHEMLELHELLNNEIIGIKKAQMSMSMVQNEDLKNFVKESVNTKKGNIQQMENFINQNVK